MKENGYTKVVKRYTDEALIEMLNCHDKYVDEMIQAVIWECGLRSIIHQNMAAIESNLIIEEAIVEEEPLDKTTPVFEIRKKEPIQIATPLFSQTAILAFTVIFSAFWGGILFIYNLSKVDKKGILPTSLFLVVYCAVIIFVSTSAPLIIAFLLNIGCGLILSEIFWNQYIGKGKTYKARNIIAPLIIAIAICFGCLYLINKQNPQLLHPKITEMPVNSIS